LSFLLHIYAFYFPFLMKLASEFVYLIDFFL
jgi:hypothetical protein